MDAGRKEGEEKMVKVESVEAIESLRRQGMKIKRIARLLRMSRNTVRRVLSVGRAALTRRRGQRENKLAKFEDFVRGRLPEVGYNAWRVYQEIQPQGYKGSYRPVCRFAQPIRDAAREAIEATMRYETAPGRQAQVDFGEIKLWMGDVLTKVHIFVMVLGYSRGLYAEAFLSEGLPSIVAGHGRAFEHFGGIPDEILYDNPRTIVKERDAEGQRIVWNPKFWEMVRYYGYTSRLCRPYWPQTKGKVESGVKYVKRGCLMGFRPRDMDHLNEHLMEWIRTVADVRIHGTTHERPVDRMKLEKLTPLSGRPVYVLPNRQIRIVPRDALVSFETNRYAVPPDYVGRTVEVQIGREGRVEVFHEGLRIADHGRAAGKYQVITGGISVVRRDRRQAAGLGLQPRIMRAETTPDVEIRDLSVYESLAALPVRGEG